MPWRMPLNVLVGCAAPGVAYLGVRELHPTYPSMTFLVLVAAATAVGTPAGVVAAVASAPVIAVSVRTPDPWDAFVFLAIALAVPVLAERGRRNSERLRRSERLYRNLVESLPVGLYLDAPDGSALNLYSNPALLEMFGWTAEEWKSPGFLGGILHPDDRDRVLADTEPVDGSPFELTYRLRARDGSYRTILDRGSLVLDHAGEPAHVQGVLLDVTAQKELEAAALVASRRYQSLVENLPLVTYVEDAREVGKTVYISPQVEELLGYPAERWLSEKDFFFTVLDPVFHEPIKRARGNPRTTQEFRLLAADGSERWIHSERITVNGADGAPMFVQGLWIDLTEKRQLEERLAQQDRLDAVGQLAAGIAHNFNNMLVAIRGYAELASKRPTTDAVLRRDLDVIVGTAERAADLVRHLLAFSRRQVLAPRPTDLRAVLEDLLGMLGQLLGSTVEIELDAPDEPVIAHVDRSQFEQAIVNLAINARDAMPGGGRLTIALREVDDADSGRIVISVSDTGSGIAPDEAGRIFDPFFTTKASGSGLGLATAHGTISQSGGELRLSHTAPGQGTTFEIELPRALSPNVAAA
jgi:PAS domain S-box-containing protein